MRRETPPNQHETESPEFQELVSTFDFQALGKLFEKAAEETDSKKEVNLPDRNNINEQTALYGEYHPEDKTVAINLVKIKKLAETTGIAWRPLAEKILIHENVHAFTDQECPQTRWAIEERHIGYDKMTRLKKTPIGKRFYYLWNEGCTELWARDLFHQYQSKTHGMKDTEMDELFKKIADFKNTPNEHPYEDEIELVEAFISYIAKTRGMDETIIRKSVLQGMIKGELFSESESREVIEDVLPPNFLDDLERASRHTTVRRLARELRSEIKGGVPTPLMKSRFMRRLLRIAEGILESSSHIL